MIFDNEQRTLYVKKTIRENIEVAEDFLNSDYKLEKILEASEMIFVALNNNQTVFTCGNGGSMADAIHFTAELVGRFLVERGPLSSVALGTNPSVLSAISNDYGYESSFSRELCALATPGDILVVFSTSGSSDNILEVVKLANKKGIKVIAFLGGKDSQITNFSDVAVHVSSYSTPRIQECHTLFFHIICQVIDRYMIE